MARLFLAAASTLACLAQVACNRTEAPEPVTERPVLAGPLAEDLPLGPETHLDVPPPVGEVGRAAQTRFYWFHPGAASHALTFEVRAQAAEALSTGSVIHTETRTAGPGETQGLVIFGPATLNRGGARRNAQGQLEWQPGLYSLTVTLDTGEELGMRLFRVP